MALSDNIKKAREKQGFSQEYIADKLNVSRQAVSKWETGQSEPSTQNLLQLAEVLKVDANILLNESRERKVFAKENIEQKGLRTILNKRNTIFLTASCAAQMAVFCVNQGQVSEQAYMLRLSFLEYLWLYSLLIYGFQPEKQVEISCMHEYLCSSFHLKLYLFFPVAIWVA